MKSNFFTRFIKDVAKKLITLIRSILVYTAVFVLIFAFLGILGSAFGSPQNFTTVYYAEKEILNQGGADADKIVIVPLNGVIVTSAQNALFGSQSIISPDKIENIFLQVRSDPTVKAVIFDTYSPGGSPVASDRIYEMIDNFQAETSIPVIFLFGDLATSGAYYIAAASDFIIANPATLTGSIGVIMETYNLEGLYEKIGVSKNTFKEGEYKDILSDNRQITEEERQIIQALNRNTYDLFVSRVADGRQLDLDYVTELANGQIYSGKEAYDLQLVDSLGNTDEAIYQAKKLANLNQVKVVKYYRANLFDEIFGTSQISGSISNFFTNLIYLPKELWQQR